MASFTSTPPLSNKQKGPYFLHGKHCSHTMAVSMSYPLSSSDSMLRSGNMLPSKLEKQLHTRTND